MPEKLLSIKEVSELLKISEEEVKRLVDIGEIPAYKIGGSFLRFRKEQIDAIRSEITEIEEEEPEHAKPQLDASGHVDHKYTELEREVKRREPVVAQYDYTFVERIRDFFYFHDFYFLSFLIIAALLYVIFVKG
jgi:excisionase family DNA binding protein